MDLIDREVLIRKLKAWDSKANGIPNYAWGVIKEMPSADKPTGHWEWVQYDANPEIGNFHCSVCGYIPASFNMSAQKLNYCPNCGAKML